MTARFFWGGVAALVFFSAGVAVEGATVSGPVLTANIEGWSFSGIAFRPLRDTRLSSFVYQNQGQADTIFLSDSQGNIVHSASSPAGETSHTFHVDWALTNGNVYWLMQSVESNGMYADYFQSLPSNDDIEITNVGAYGASVLDVVNVTAAFAPTWFWANFNDIHTGSDPVPEIDAAGVGSVLAVVIGSLGLLERRRRPGA